jgi:hypothetical protein
MRTTRSIKARIAALQLWAARPRSERVRIPRIVAVEFLAAFGCVMRRTGSKVLAARAAIKRAHDVIDFKNKPENAGIDPEPLLVNGRLTVTSADILDQLVEHAWGHKTWLPPSRCSVPGTDGREQRDGPNRWRKVANLKPGKRGGEA